MMRAIRASAAGAADVLQLHTDVPRPAAPTGNQLLLRVHATAVNRADLLQRQGHYPPPPGAGDILGLEAAGVVEAVGPTATRFKVGERVMALLLGGGYAEYVLLDERHAMAIPANLSFVQAAALPEAWITAYQLLHYIGKATAGETVLLHAAASGVGTALIQLAKAANVRSLATVGSDEKVAFTSNLGASAAFNYKKGSFAAFVKEQTGGKGVQLILDPVGASYWQDNGESIALDGRWILYGSMGGVNTEGPLLGLVMRKRVTLVGTTLRSRTDDYKADLIAAFAAHALPRFADSTFKPIIDRTFHIKDAAQAHRHVESNGNSGKVVLVFDDADLPAPSSL